jgi:hypothetical protein
MTVTVIRRNRLGNDTEDITLIPPRRPTIESSIAIMDGYDVLNIPLSILRDTGGDKGLAKATASAGHGNQPTAAAAAAAAKEIEKPAEKLFNVLGLSIRSGPRGIAYLETSGQYVVDDPLQPTKLFFAKKDGSPVRILDIQFLNGYVPTFVEGLGYVPRSDEKFSNHIIMVTVTAPQGQIESRLQVIRPRDGQVVHEIIPAKPVGSKYLTGVCYAGPDRLLVSTDDDNEITELDFEGNVVGPGVPPPELRTQGFEGLVQTLDGRVAAANIFSGILVLLHRKIAKSLERFRYPIGVGLSVPSGLTWDTTTNHHLVFSFVRFQPTDNRFISAVSPSLNSARQVVKSEPIGRQLAYLPDEKLIALTQRTQTSSILLFSEDGKQVQKIDLDPTTIGRVFAFTYLPRTHEFVVSYQLQPSTLLVLSRKGEIVRTIDMSSTGIAAITSVAFMPSRVDGQFLITDRDSSRAVLTKFNGKKIGEFDIRKDLQLVRPSAVAAITTGPDAGAFSIVDSDNSELVVFRFREG